MWLCFKERWVKRGVVEGIQILIEYFCFLIFPEKDPYPIDALPTCNHALSVCQSETKCIALFNEFKTHCKVRDNKCRMEDR